MCLQGKAEAKPRSEQLPTETDMTKRQNARCGVTERYQSNRKRLSATAPPGAHTSLAKGVILKKGKKYTADLPRLLYSAFLAMVNDGVPPSFSKFARSAGVTLAELESLREKHKELERAWRECIEIRRDYLTDSALTRRYDPSFVKFLLTENAGADGGEEDINVTVTVTDG